MHPLPSKRQPAKKESQSALLVTPVASEQILSLQKPPELHQQAWPDELVRLLHFDKASPLYELQLLLSIHYPATSLHLPK